ncbi:MAG: hypothetical protein ACRD8W_04515 [Nitrososphaeraceae archaeon]
MPIGCKGLCNLYQIRGGGNHSVYQAGYKRCTECGIYIKYAKNRCPCCSCVLRTKKRNYSRKTGVAFAEYTIIENKSSKGLQSTEILLE